MYHRHTGAELQLRKRIHMMGQLYKKYCHQAQAATALLLIHATVLSTSLHSLTNPRAKYGEVHLLLHNTEV